MSMSNRQHRSDMTSHPAVAGWLLGVVLGLGFSWMPCRWIHHATANSRALLPAFEAMAAGEPEVASTLLKEAEGRVVFDRLWERPELREGIRGLGTKVPELFSTGPATDGEEREEASSPDAKHGRSGLDGRPAAEPSRYEIRISRAP